MRRRGSRENTVSLFAFQDVMASVIGILFFVVLLMATDMVNKESSSDSESGPDQRVQELRRELQERTSELEAMKMAVIRSSEKVSLVMKDDKEIEQSIRELDMRHKALCQTLQQREKSVNDLRELSAKQKERVDKLKNQLVLLNKKLQEKDRQLAEVGRTPRLSYIIDSRSDNLEPWLVDLSSKRIIVGTQDGTQTATTFQGDSAEAMTAKFLKWAGTQNPRQKYFVLLIRPSATKMSEDVRLKLTEARFQIGTDLLPEDWKVFE